MVEPDAVAVDREGPGIGESCLALDERDAVRPAELLDAPRHSGDHVGRPLDHHLAVEVGIGADPHRLRFLGPPSESRCREEGLRRDAPRVEASATELRLLDQRRLDSELRPTDGSGVPAGAAANDDEFRAVRDRRSHVGRT
jgi:hypothetical protein